MISYSRPELSDFYTLSQTKLLENHTLHSGTYPYSLYTKVPPPPPPGTLLSIHDMNVYLNSTLIEFKVNFILWYIEQKTQHFNDSPPPQPQPQLRSLLFRRLKNAGEIIEDVTEMGLFTPTASPSLVWLARLAGYIDSRGSFQCSRVKFAFCLYYSYAYLWVGVTIDVCNGSLF